MSHIVNVEALEVLDSRGNPTVAAYVETEVDKGLWGFWAFEFS